MKNKLFRSNLWKRLLVDTKIAWADTFLLFRVSGKEILLRGGAELSISNRETVSLRIGEVALQEKLGQNDICPTEFLLPVSLFGGCAGDLCRWCDKIPDQAKLREGSFRQCEGAARQDGNSWWWSHGGRSLPGLVALCPQSRSRE